jgi:uncharacterized membrane protein YqjE
VALSAEELRKQQQAAAGPGDLAGTLQDVVHTTQTLVREEIELAKAEVSQKAAKLIKGAVVGIAAGIFVVFGLLFMLHGLAWLAWDALFSGSDYFWGFLLVAGALFVLGGLAGFLAAKALKSGSPPTPQLAIDEAKLIKETYTSPHPETVHPTLTTQP